MHKVVWNKSDGLTYMQYLKYQKFKINKWMTTLPLQQRPSADGVGQRDLQRRPEGSWEGRLPEDSERHQRGGGSDVGRLGEGGGEWGGGGQGVVASR